MVPIALIEGSVERVFTPIRTDAAYDRLAGQTRLLQTALRRPDHTGEGVVLVIERDTDDGLDAFDVSDRGESSFDVPFELPDPRPVYLLFTVDGCQSVFLGSSCRGVRGVNLSAPVPARCRVIARWECRPSLLAAYLAEATAVKSSSKSRLCV